MKIGIGADTGDFDKGAKKVKQEMKDLSKVSSDAFGAIGNAIGVDTGKLGQFSSALQGIGTKLQQTGNEGAAAFGSILKSIGPVATGIAGLGIGAAVTAFKALKSEAEAFGNTIDGLNLKLSTQAYIDTYRQALHDANSETGKSVGEAMAEWQKGWARFKSNVGATFVQWVAGEDTVGLAEAWQKVSAAAEQAEAAAERNEARGSRMADVLKKELQVRKEVADIDLKIAQQQRIIRDNSKSAAERSQAEAEVRDLISQKTEKQKAIAQELYELQAAMAGETNSSYEEMAKVTSAYEHWQGILTAEENSMAKIDRYANSIKNSTDETAKNIARIKALRESGNKLQAVSSAGIPDLSQYNRVQVPAELIVPSQQEFSRFKELVDFQLAGMDFQIGIELDAEKWQETAQHVADGLKSAMAQGVESMATAVGALLGDLATGQNGWENFANAAISAFGDMAISVGKIAIEAGTSVIALNAALSSMSVAGAYAAIAAGAALVILGSAVKTGMANIAKGNYSSSMGVASSSTTSSLVNAYEQRDVYVNVQGTLVADGDQLLAVINNTDKKNYFTT